MRSRGLRFLSRYHTSLALGPALAYLFEAPNIINPSGDGDLAFQQITRVWTIFGIIALGALVTILALIIMVRKRIRKRQEAMSLSTADVAEDAQSLFLQNVASFHYSWYEVRLAEFRRSIEENQRRHDVTKA